MTSTCMSCYMHAYVYLHRHTGTHKIKRQNIFFALKFDYTRSVGDRTVG